MLLIAHITLKHIYKKKLEKFILRISLRTIIRLPKNINEILTKNFSDKSFLSAHTYIFKDTQFHS